MNPRSDGLVEGWARRSRGPSKHLRLALLHPDADGPVPGCGCLMCLTLAAGGDADAAAEAEAAVETLAGLPPEDRADTAREWERERQRHRPGVVLPPPGVLALLAARKPGAVGKRQPRGRLDPRRVERARAVVPSEAARMLGLEAGRQLRGGGYFRCPFHDDHDPSLHANDRKGRAFCNPCGRSWDAIQLVRDVQDCGFREAVEFLT